MRIVFFDIDGTLITTGGCGTDALKKSFREVFGLDHADGIDAHGRTDRGIARGLFGQHGLPDSDDNWHRFHESYQRHLAAELPLRSGTVLPGVAEFLERLTRLDDVAIGLLTGNTPQGAQIKLEFFQLNHFFAFGGFGLEHPDRNDVAVQAVQAATRHLGRTFPGESVWVIGDTPADIACARHIGANAVAVATGFSSLESLVASEPDLLLKDLCDCDLLMEQLDG